MGSNSCFFLWGGSFSGQFAPADADQKDDGLNAAFKGSAVSTESWIHSNLLFLVLIECKNQNLDHISVPPHMNERKTRTPISSLPARLSLCSAAMQRELK